MVGVDLGGTTIKMAFVSMDGDIIYRTKLTEEEKEIVKKQVSDFKEIRSLIQFGDFYRLLSPFEGNETPLTVLRVGGLDLNKKYQVIGTDRVFGGDKLSFVGISIPVSLKGDFQSCVWHLKEVGI